VDEERASSVWETDDQRLCYELGSARQSSSIQTAPLPYDSEKEKQVEKESFQNPFQTDEALRQWFDIGLMEWDGNDEVANEGCLRTPHS